MKISLILQYDLFKSTVDLWSYVLPICRYLDMPFYERVEVSNDKQYVGPWVHCFKR